MIRGRLTRKVQSMNVSVYKVDEMKNETESVDDDKRETK